jgi:hypothetical protein
MNDNTLLEEVPIEVRETLKCGSVVGDKAQVRRISYSAIIGWRPQESEGSASLQVFGGIIGCLAGGLSDARSTV